MFSIREHIRVLSVVAFLIAAVLLGGCQQEAPSETPGAASAPVGPEMPIRTPAEFEPVERVIMQWDFNECNEFHKEIIEHVTRAGARVLLLIDNQTQGQQIVGYLEQNNVLVNDIDVLMVETDSIWARDYSGTNVFYGEDKVRGYIDWSCTYPGQFKDDASPFAVASAFGMELYAMSHDSLPFLLDGGDFMADGFGTAFSSKRILDDNPLITQAIKPLMQTYMGIGNYILLEKLADRRDKHIDMYMKLVDEETLVIGQYTNNEAGNIPIERNVEIIQGLKTCYGTPYRIFRIPIPGDPTKKDFRTYTNALIVNDHILVPVFGIPLDEEALSVFREAMPGYKVVGVDCTEVVKQNGAIHCVTKEINRSQLICIGHPRFIEPHKLGDTITFKADYWSTGTVDKMTLYLAWEGEEAFTPHPMLKQDDAFEVSLKADRPGAARYYIEAEGGDIKGYKPQNAYAGGYLTLEVVE